MCGDCGTRASYTDVLFGNVPLCRSTAPTPPSAAPKKHDYQGQVGALWCVSCGVSYYSHNVPPYCPGPSPYGPHPDSPVVVEKSAPPEGVCVDCNVKLSDYMDAFYGDPKSKAAKQCVNCRHGRKHSNEPLRY